MVTLNEIIKNSLDTSISLYCQNALKIGNNYVYGHENTLVEPYSYWVVSALDTYVKTNEKKYLEFSESLIDIMITQNINNYTYHCRNQIDRPNGVIGQARVIKSLIEVFKVNGDQKYLKQAEKLFLTHPFDNHKKLWYRVDIDGKNLGIDYTFNHQLCFAVYSYPLMALTKNKEIEGRINGFLNNIDSNLSIRTNGQIVHPIKFKSAQTKVKYFLLNIYNYFLYKKNHYQTKEPGYHGFNMMLFSLLYKENKNHPIFKLEKFTKALDYFTSKEYENKIDLKKEPYFFTYAKVELSITLETFFDAEESKIKRLLSEFINEYYDFNNNTLGKNSFDKDTMSSMVYLLTFLEKDYELDLK